VQDNVPDGGRFELTKLDQLVKVAPMAMQVARHDDLPVIRKTQKRAFPNRILKVHLGRAVEHINR